jgi:hypothetical protein
MAIKAWGPLFAWLMLAGAAISGLVMEHSEPYNRCQPTITPCRNRPECKSITIIASNENDDKGKQESNWYDKPTDWLLALFTGILALYTRRLYQATAGLFNETAELRRIADEQRIDLSRSIAAAEKSAEAAKHSADATIALERPYLSAFEATLVQPSGPKDPNPHIIYSITNLGRVPGVIRIIYAEAILRGIDPLDPIATYRKDKFMYARSMIGGGGKIAPTHLPPVSFNKAISEQDYIDIKEDRNIILFKILLIYSGPLDFTYYSAVAYKIDINTGLSYPIGGDAYNYEKTEKGRATKVMPEIRVIP